MRKVEVIELMKSSQSQEEWEANEKKVLEEFDGYYPRYWYEEIIASGLAVSILDKDLTIK